MFEWSKVHCGMMSDISIAVVGDSKCGKTKLINRFAKGSFSEVSKQIFCYKEI